MYLVLVRVGVVHAPLERDALLQLELSTEYTLYGLVSETESRADTVFVSFHTTHRYMVGLW